MTSAPVDRPVGATNYAMNAARIIAAYMVVISHIRPLFFADYSQSDNTDAVTQLLYALTSVGHQAVIVFFVLSGYWVGGSVIRGLSRGSFSTAHYAVARITRLWVVLIPAIILTQVIDRVGLALRPDSDIYTGSPAYHTVVPVGGPLPNLDAPTTLGNLAFLQDIDVPSLGTNTALWSLAAEFWYYLLFPAALIAVWRGVSTVTRLVAAAVFVGGVLIVALPTQPDPTNVLGLFPAWLLGAAVAWQKPRIAALLARSRQGALTAARWVAVVAVIGAAVVDSRSGSTPSALALSLATAFLIATLVIDVQSRTAKTFLSPLSWAAEWSYSLYATHLPVVAFLAALIVPFAADRWQMTPATFGLLVAISIVPLAVGVLFYFLAEKHTGVLRSVANRYLRVRASTR